MTKPLDRPRKPNSVYAEKNRLRAQWRIASRKRYLGVKAEKAGVGAADGSARPVE